MGRVKLVGKGQHEKAVPDEICVRPLVGLHRHEEEAQDEALQDLQALGCNFIAQEGG